jgi:hypothetical protein
MEESGKKVPKTIQETIASPGNTVAEEYIKEAHCENEKDRNSAFGLGYDPSPNG